MVIQESLSKGYPFPNMDMDKDNVGIYNRPDSNDVPVDNDLAEE